MPSSCYAVLAPLSRGYSPPEGRLSTCYAPVRHAPISLYCYRKLRVRLACVKHAASVRSEPGSNSRLKPDVSTVAARSCHDRNELLNRSVLSRLDEAKQDFSNSLLLRYTRNKRPKPNGFWHVSSDCQRAGTSWPAGRTTDEPRYYRNAIELSSALKILFKILKSFLRFQHTRACRYLGTPLSVESHLKVSAMKGAQIVLFAPQFLRSPCSVRCSPDSTRIDAPPTLQYPRPRRFRIRDRSSTEGYDYNVVEVAVVLSESLVNNHALSDRNERIRFAAERDFLAQTAITRKRTRS